jgi:hypothetical protein
VPRSALRCRFCGAPFPRIDIQTLSLIAVGLPIVLVALAAALFVW